MIDNDICQYLEWDSNFFGIKIGRLTVTRLCPEVIDTFLCWRQRHRIDCVYFLADPDDDVTVRLAEEHGFHLVDIRVTLEKKFPEHPIFGEDEHTIAKIRPSTLDDIPILRGIARTSYRDSRFYYDSGFPKDKCDELYEIWVDKSCNGYADAVLVAEINGIVGGFISCHQDKNLEGNIGLVGVSPQFQGKGLGQILVKNSLKWFRERNIDQVRVVTQGRNIKAQRLYMKCGFTIQSLKLWYHCWRFS